MAHANSQTGGTTFLDLPLELREHIYKFTLLDSADQTRVAIVLPALREEQFFIHVYSSLMLTCRQTHLETHAFMLAELKTNRNRGAERIDIVVKDCDFSIITEHLFSKDRSTGDFTPSTMKLLRNVSGPVFGWPTTVGTRHQYLSISLEFTEDVHDEHLSQLDTFTDWVDHCNIKGFDFRPELTRYNQGEACARAGKLR